MDQSSSQVRKNDLLKIIAIVTMVVDHVGLMFFPELLVLRTIGRIAFPIFAYGIAMGYSYTHSKKKYLIRLLIFGLLSQAPYMYLNRDFVPEWLHFNVILLFAYSFLMLFVYDLMIRYAKEKKYVFTILAVFALVPIVLAPELLEIYIDDFMFSYSTYGLLLVLLFYICKDRILPMVLGYLAISFLGTYMTGAKYVHMYAVQWTGSQLSYIESLLSKELIINNITSYKDGLKTLDGYFFQSRSILGLLSIIIGQRFTFKFPSIKYVAYAFYPAHIIILIIIRVIIEGPLH